MPRLLSAVIVPGLLIATWLTTAKFATEQGEKNASAVKDEHTVAALDTEYQYAVKSNDAKTMARILSDDFVLVTGTGRTLTKADMLDDAKRGDLYERNDEEVRSIRVWGGTAVVTAKLWEKYTSSGKSFEHKFWFSDVYVCTASGWKYVFGQSSIPLPNDGGH